MNYHIKKQSFVTNDDLAMTKNATCFCTYLSVILLSLLTIAFSGCSASDSTSPDPVSSITVTAGSTSIVANASDQTVIKLTAVNSSSEPIVGTKVTFTTTAGTLSAASAVTNNNGIAQVTLTAGTQVGSATVKANASGFWNEIPIIFVPGSVNYVVLVSAPSTVNTSGTSSISATIYDAYNNVIVGETVTFGFTAQGSGASALSEVTAVTNANGIASTSYTAGSASGTDTITATTTNATTSSINITVDAAAVVVDAITVTASTTSIVADAVDSTSIRATVFDMDNNPAIGVPVAFSTTAGTLSLATATTDSNGIAQVTLTASNQVGSATVSANASGFTNKVTIIFVPGSVNSVALVSAPSTIHPTGTSIISATITDANNNVIAEETVTFAFTAQGSGTSALSAVTAVTNTNGIASTSYTAGSTSGTDTITATTTNKTTSSVDITVDAAAVIVDSITVTASTLSIVADASDSTSISATVLDIDNNPVVGVSVAFSTSAGTLSLATATTNSNGFVEVQLTTGTQAGSATVRADASGFKGEVIISFIPGSVNSVALVSAPSTVNTTGTSSISATITDANNNVITGEKVTFAFTAQGSGASTLSVVTALTNANGIASTSYTAGSTSGTDTITATTTNTTTSSVAITVDDAAVIVDSITVSAGATSIVANASDNTSIRATVLDIDNNPAIGVPVAFSTNAGILSPATATTDSNGIAEVTLTASTQVGSATVTANASGFINKITILFGPGSVNSVALVSAPSTVNTTGTSNLSATISDANNNVIEGERVTFAFTAQGSGAPALSAVTAVTNANGIASTSYTAGNTNGTDTVSATTSNGKKSSTSITVATGAVIVNAITVTAGTTSIVADASDSTSIRATVLDKNSNPVVGVSVAFFTTAGTLSATTASTDSDGIAQITLTAGTQAGAATVTANASGFSKSVVINFVPGPVEFVWLFFTPTSVASTASSNLRALISDVSGNVIVGETVTFAITVKESGSSALSAVTAVTNANGIASTSYTAGTTTGTDTVSGTTTNSKTDSQNIVVTTGGVTVNSITVTSGATSIVADTSDSTSIRAIVLGNDDNPVVGVPVTFFTTAGTLSSASDVTDTNGIAQVTLTAGTKSGSATATANTLGFSKSIPILFVPGSVNSIALISAPSTVSTTGTSSISATITDLYDNVIAGETVTFAFTAQGSGSSALSAVTAVTNANGIATTTYTAGNTNGVDTLSATTSNGKTNPANITVDVTVAKIGALQLITANSDITADGSSRSLMRATLTDSASNPIVGATVSFATTGGTLEDLAGTPGNVADTDNSGEAVVYLKAGSNPATVLVTADSGGYSDTVTVRFIPGTPSSVNSSITASPSTVPSDGTSTTEVTVLLIDANNNLVSNGTTVSLFTTDGFISSAPSAVTNSGQATFTVQAPNSSTTATLSVSEYPAITGSIIFGMTGTGQPANITTAAGNQLLSISGVGQSESTSIAITVYDDKGLPIVDADPGVDNVKVTFVSRPNGGEFISGLKADVTIDNSIADDEIEVRTVSGAITINLQTGTLPGIIELQIEVYDVTGASLTPPILAQIPQISIASGPPHTIALSTPITDSIENIGSGFYRRKGMLIVTDRFGNAVADGTPVNLGIVDSVIFDGSDGVITPGATDLNSESGDFVSAAIPRQNVQRFIQENDRVLITDIDILQEDKARFVGNVTAATNTTLPVQSAYLASKSPLLSYTNLEYVVGAALLGTEIAGITGTGVLTTGSVITTDGLAEIRVTYPANSDTIFAGCGSMGDSVDSRFLPDQSSAVAYTVATTTNSDAALVDARSLCMAAISPYTLAANSTAISGTSAILLTLRDGGDGIRLPFVFISANTTVTKGGVTVTATGGMTDLNGQFISIINVTGEAPEDAATITYTAEKASVEVKLTLP